MDMKSFLESLDEAFAAAEVQENRTEFEPIPDGKYTVFVDTAELKEAKNGKPMLALRLEILEGPHRGRKLFKNNVIQQNTVAILKQDLTRMGYAIDKLSELDPVDLLDRKLEVQKKTKEGYENIYINKFLGFVEGGNDGEDSDTPF